MISALPYFILTTGLGQYDSEKQPVSPWGVGSKKDKPCPMHQGHEWEKRNLQDVSCVSIHLFWVKGCRSSQEGFGLLGPAFGPGCTEGWGCKAAGSFWMSQRGKDSSCSWGASQALTKTGRTLQSCKCNKTTQKTRKRKISNNVYKGLGYGPSFLKLANQRGQCHWFLQQRFQLALLGCSTLLEAVFLARKVTFPSHPDTFLSSLLLFLFSLPLSSTENSMRSSGRNSVTAKSI